MSLKWLPLLIAPALLTIACGGGSPTPSPSATPTEVAPSPTPTPTVAPAAFSPGDWVEVVTAEECLDTFYPSPSPVTAPDCVPVPSGFVPLIVDGPDKTEGGPWWSLAGWGWVPEKSLRFHHGGEPPYPKRPELADIGRIAFIAPDGAVWIMNGDGSGKELLLDPTGQSGGFRLHWSPDGSNLAVSGTGDPLNVLHIVSADGDSILQLDEIAWFGGWSPASDAFAVARFPVGGLSGDRPFHDTVVLDLNGDILIELPNAQLYGSPFSADGRKLAFSEFVDPGDFGYCPEVRALIADLHTGDVQPIDTQKDPGNPIHLWSPNDPSLLAYGRLLINFDAGEERVLPGLAFGWSPDGRFLLLSVERYVRRQVYDIATSAAALEWKFAIPLAGMTCSPTIGSAWSPGGRYLAYYEPDILEPAAFRRSLQIWDAAGGQRGAFLSLPNLLLGEFSPSGQHRLFGNDGWISIMDIDGSAYTLLAEGSEPTWQPRP